jgi:hypothetical protein
VDRGPQAEAEVILKLLRPVRRGADQGKSNMTKDAKEQEIGKVDLREGQPRE